MTTMQSQPACGGPTVETEPHSELMDVTPEMAERWLKDGNTHNRKMNPFHVERLARDILSGHFKVSHQGIAFSPGGVLLDGQSRLAAIVLAQRPVKMYVWFDMPMETQSVTDVGTARTAADVLTLSDRFGTVGKREVACLRSMVIGLKGRQKFTTCEESDMLAEHREAIVFSLQHTYSKTCGVFTSTTAAVVARAWYTQDVAKLKQFCNVLRDPGAIGPNEGAATMLWAWLVKSPFRRGVSQRERYAKTERALSAFLNGETLDRLYVTRYELFPLPGEVCAAPVIDAG